MTVDPKAYDFSRVWLKAGGWGYDVDVTKLAELVQSVCQDFEADLENSGEVHRD